MMIEVHYKVMSLIKKNNSLSNADSTITTSTFNIITHIVSFFHAPSTPNPSSSALL